MTKSGFQPRKWLEPSEADPEERRPFPDFASEAYGPYRTVCRGIPDLRWYEDDPRWQDGDWYCLETDTEPIEPALRFGWWRGATIVIPSAPSTLVRLPYLHEWLTMLEEAGARYFRFYDGARTKGHAPGWHSSCVMHDGPRTRYYSTATSSREESTARLWCAVTGRSAPLQIQTTEGRETTTRP